MLQVGKEGSMHLCDVAPAVESKCLNGIEDREDEDEK